MGQPERQTPHRLGPVAVTEVTVVVPAHNEADTVAACVRSVDAAAGQVAPVPVRLVVVADACTDATPDIVRSLRLTTVRLEVREVSFRRVGAVRHAGFADAARGTGSWYATTDADSFVPDRWLRTQLESAEVHDLFVGTVDVQDWSGRPLGLATTYAALYHPMAPHRHIHATNLGVRAATYWRAGGFPDVLAHEDLALVTACEAKAAAIDWSVSAPVVTSARRSERTPTGFSDYLSRLESGRPA